MTYTGEAITRVVASPVLAGRWLAGAGGRVDSQAMPGEALLERCGAWVAAQMTPARWGHSLGVMRIMGRLAPLYGLAPTAAAAAGLLHDVAKDYPAAAQLDLAAALGVALDDPCERHPVYLHGLVGAALLRDRGLCADEDVLDAIAAHSYNRRLRPSSELLGWCLRCADVLAPVQPWRGMERLSEHVYNGDLAVARRLLCHWVVEYYQANALPVHPLLAITERELRPTARLGAAGWARW